MTATEPQIGYLIKQAQSRLRARMEEALVPLGLTVSQYSCLHRVQREPGISAAALARSVFMTRQSMSAMLQQLIDRDLVTRPAQPTTGRALPMELTGAGARLLDAAEARVGAVEERMLEQLSPEDRDALARGLSACSAALEG